MNKLSTTSINRRDLLQGVIATAGAQALHRNGPLDYLSLSPSAHQHFLLGQHRFGVNYVPSCNWSYCWNAWNAPDIARDFDAIASLGADHMRIQLIWPWFQPNPAVISEAHLARLEVLMRLAAERNLDVLVTCFTGWLSGYAFRPPYFEEKDFFQADEWATAQELFIKSLGTLLVSHKNFLGFDIANEINNCWRTTPEIGDIWMDRIFGLMKRYAPGRVHVNGEDPQPWFTVRNFSPKRLCELQDIVPLHVYPFWAGAKRFGGIHEKPYTHLAAAMAALARSYSEDEKKPIWLAEFGASRIEMPEADLPQWMERAVLTSIRGGIAWFTWWGSHDVERKYKFNDFEYDLGLLTTDNRIKPQGEMFRRLANQYRGKQVIFPGTRLPAPPVNRTDEATWNWILKWFEEGN